MCDTVGIKLPIESSLAKSVSIIRNIEPTLAISEISSRIKNNQYVLVYDYTDSQGIKNIIRCFEEMTKLGIIPKLFELDDKECDIQLLKNLNNMYEEIDKYYDDNEEE